MEIKNSPCHRGLQALVDVRPSEIGREQLQAFRQNLAVDRLQLQARSAKTSQRMYDAVDQACRSYPNAFRSDRELVYREALYNDRFCDEKTRLYIARETDDPITLKELARFTKRPATLNMAANRLVTLAARQMPDLQSRLESAYNVITEKWVPPAKLQETIHRKLGIEPQRIIPQRPAPVLSVLTLFACLRS